MKKFTTRVIIYIFPVFLFLVFPFYKLINSKEIFHNIDNNINQKEKYLIGYKYNENNYKYIKYKTIKEFNNLEILALGSSRVLQFRSEMFNKPFYNAGFTISSINDFQNFLELIPKSKLPKYLIIGLDQWMFNENWDDLKKYNFDNNLYKQNKSYSYKNGFSSLKYVYEDILKGNITDKKKIKFTSIGLNAINNHSGLRNDGSFYYGKQINSLINKNNSAKDYNYNDTFKRIDNGNRRFEYAKNTNSKAILILNEFLLFCKKSNIKVVGVLPPFADKVYDRMLKSNNYQYINKIYPTVKPIFKKYNFEVYQFNTVKDCNSNDNETIDGFHGGEKTYLKLLINMLENDSYLNSICDIKKLRADLNNAINNYIVYEY